MNPGCERYLNDPDAESAHLAECAGCAALARELGSETGHKPLAVRELPLAPWEGASHRAWPVVVLGALLLAGVAAVLFLMAGVSPLRGLVRAAVAGFPPLDLVLTWMRLTGSAVHGAPPMWQLALGGGVLVVNTILVLLLRRAPRGMDA